jgi:hypothetical protein
MAQRKFQHTFTKSKMNKDLDARLLAADEYRDGSNIAVSRAEADDVGALENILGNTLVTTLNNASVYLEQVIGWHISEDTNKVYIFATDYQDNTPDQLSLFCPVGTKNSILVVNTESNTVKTIVDGRFLNFSWNSPILDTVMLENLLFFTDNRNQPRVINVTTAEANPNYYFHEDHVSLAKYYPHKPIQLNSEFSATGALVTATALSSATSISFDGLYNFIIIPDGNVSEAMSKTLLGVNFNSSSDLQGQVNFGLQGYTIGNSNEIVNFKVAWVQKTEPGDIPSPFSAGYVIAIDRDLTSLLTAQTTSFSANKTFYFVDENAKDVTSPWLQEDQTKLELKTVSSTVATYTASATSALEAARALYKFGTRSPINAQTDVFYFEKHFIKNTGTNQRGYCRITHPKLDPNRYYVISSVNTAGTAAQDFQISELSSLVDGSYSTVASNSVLAAGDVVTVHWPNKYYNQNFIGDEAFLEDKFVRFAYRFQYEDGQYSLIAPFTQNVFIPKQRGYFLKKIGRLNSTGSSTNQYVKDEQKAGETTIVDFMENQVSQVQLSIPCEYAFNTLQDNLKVKAIEILYKESTQQSIKVVESIDIDSESIVNNTTKILNYTYNSKEPIKTLRSSETTRVYDNVPVRAKTLSSSGNRVILGNFYDRPSSPESLSYFVGASRKFTPGETTADVSSPYLPEDLPNKYSTVSYPNHSLKQNRNYQVGIILQDRYGRSSDVILSSITEDNFTFNTGVHANNPIEFSGSTLYHEYLESVVNPQTASSAIATSPVTRAGIVDWPGDSLKLLFSDIVPQLIPTLPGYPGVYEDPFTVTPAVSGTNYDYIKVSSGGNNDNISPGMKATWTNSGVDYFGYVWLCVGGSTSHFIFLKDEDGNSLSVYPVVSDSVSFFYASNPLGYYSYKVVVKQLQQEYYNVYLPSLLNGIPVIKPFDLDATFTSGSNVVTMTAVGSVEYLTFALLEGMKVVTAGGNTYYINNILNYTQFELTSNATATETDVTATFSTGGNEGILNVTTLLTDNSNKVPPALNETSPVQQNFSTSDIRLIPRYAFWNDWYQTSSDPYNITNTDAMSIFPHKQSLTVQSIGNFENLFARGSYNGLYQAKTDPPTGMVENVFNIGQDSQSAKPASEAETIAAAYETTPVTSNLEIFYESSTSGTIREINELVRNSLIIPGYFVNGLASTTPGNDRVDSILVLESLDYSSTPTIATLQLVNQNGGLIKYYSTTASEIKMRNITISSPQYMDGSKILASGITFEKFSDTDVNNRFLVKLNSNFIGFNSGPNGKTNQIVFNVEFEYNSVGDVFNKAYVPIIISIDNVAPQQNVNFLTDDGTVYYLDNQTPTIDPTPTDSSGTTITWNNNNGTSTTETTATNGANTANSKQGANTNKLKFELEIKLPGTTEYVNTKSVENSGLYLNSTQEGTVKLATTGNSKYTGSNLPTRVIATDGDGQGITTTISESIIRFNPSV